MKVINGGKKEVVVGGWLGTVVDPTVGHLTSKSLGRGYARVMNSWFGNTINKFVWDDEKQELFEVKIVKSDTNPGAV